MMTPRVSRAWYSHVLVLGQLTGIALACYPVGWINRGSVAYLGVCALGTVLGLLALYYNRPGNFGIYPEVRPDTQLVTVGPYRLIRHPMYSSLIVMMGGVSLYNGHPLNFAGAALVAAVVIGKALIEERLLPAVFPEYTDYQTRTKRFVPFVI